MRDAVAAMPRTTIVEERQGYLHAECTSRIFRFVDDLELLRSETGDRVDVRSASRVGYGDWGVNRARVESLREALVAAGAILGRGAAEVNRAAVSAELARHARAHPEDAAALERFARLLDDTPEPFSRDQYQPGHVTCSACVLDAKRTHVLLVHHARLGRWLQPGGHAEPGDATPFAGALRELREESGLEGPAPLCGAGGGALIDVDVHEIPARGDEPSHLHFDLRYGFTATGGSALRRSEESIALRWVAVDRLAELGADESVTRLVARALAIARGGGG